MDHYGIVLVFTYLRSDEKQGTHNVRYPARSKIVKGEPG